MSSANGYEEALAAFQRRRDELVENQRRLKEITSTATAPRQVVSVTVGRSGELKDLRFPTNAYKNMTPAELATAILGTAEEARSAALKQSAEVLAPMLPKGVSADDLVRGTLDLSSLIPEEPRSPEDRQT